MNEKSYNIALDCIDKNGQSLLNKHKPALIYIKEGAAPLRLTFSNLLGLTNRIANALKNLGLPKGDRLVLRLPNCPEFPVSFLGAIKAGLYPIPTPPQFTAPNPLTAIAFGGEKVLSDPDLLDKIQLET